MNRLLLRVFLAIPWVGIVWLLVQAFDGNIGWLLTIVLLFILIPAAIIINIITVVAVKGSAFLKQVRNMQQAAPKSRKNKSKDRLKVDNVNDLPWYDPRRWGSDE